MLAPPPQVAVPSLLETSLFRATVDFLMANWEDFDTEDAMPIAAGLPEKPRHLDKL